MNVVKYHGNASGNNGEIIKIRALDSLTATKIEHFHVKNRPHNFNGRVHNFVGMSRVLRATRDYLFERSSL